MATLVLDHQGKLFYGKIQVVPLDKLYLHEEVIEANLISIIKRIKKKNVFQDPIIIDSKSFVVLDGMHRTVALKRLGLDYIVAFMVNYDDPLIKIRRWCRVFNLSEKVIERNNKFNKVLNELASKLELDLFSCELEQAEFLLNKRKILGYFAKSFNGDVICISLDQKELDVYQAYVTLRKIEGLISRELNIEIKYYPDDKLRNFSRQKNQIYLVPLLIKKHEVIYYAKRNMLFPPKSTRHIIPLRPFFVNIPLSLLKKTSDLSIERLNEIINIILMQKKKLKLKGRITIDRLYEDDYIIIFI